MRNAFNFVAALAMAVLMTLGAASCGEPIVAETGSTTTEPQASFGDNVPVDLAIYFREGVTDQEITDFISNVLSKPPAPGRSGQAHPDGVQYTSGDYDRGAAYVTFFPDATVEQRRAVLEAAEASPLTSQVSEDVVPSSPPTR